VDILVNNAGIQFVSPIEEFPAEKWDAIIAINLSSAFHAIRAAVPGMKARGWGRIISTASAHSLVASPYKAAYIAAKHGIAVGRDDPILILQTINMKLMQDSASAQQEILDAFKSELESIAHRWGDDAKGKAERTLNAALAASKDAMTRGMQEGAKAAAEAVRREVEAVTAQLVAPIREARRVAMMNMVAAGMAVVAAGLALWASL